MADKLKFDDFKELKTDCQAICDVLGMELTNNSIKLKLLDQQLKVVGRDLTNIFFSYEAAIILDFLYLIARNYSFNGTKMTGSLCGHRTNKKRSKNYPKLTF